MNWLENRWAKTYNSQTFNNIIAFLFSLCLFLTFFLHFSLYFILFLFLFFSSKFWKEWLGRRSSPAISCSVGGHPVGAKWPEPASNDDETRYLHNLRPVFLFLFPSQPKNSLFLYTSSSMCRRRIGLRCWLVYSPNAFPVQSVSLRWQNQPRKQ